MHNVHQLSLSWSPAVRELRDNCFTESELVYNQISFRFINFGLWWQSRTFCSKSYKHSRKIDLKRSIWFSPEAHWTNKKFRSCSRVDRVYLNLWLSSKVTIYAKSRAKLTAPHSNSNWPSEKKSSETVFKWYFTHHSIEWPRVNRELELSYCKQQSWNEALWKNPPRVLACNTQIYPTQFVTCPSNQHDQWLDCTRKKRNARLLSFFRYQISTCFFSSVC